LIFYEYNLSLSRDAGKRMGEPMKYVQGLNTCQSRLFSAQSVNGNRGGADIPSDSSHSVEFIMKHLAGQERSGRKRAV
jgi:hypothetical protein